MKIFSADMLSPAGVLYSVRYIGTEREIAEWQAVGLMPANACEVVELVNLSGALSQIEGACCLTEGTMLQ